MTIRNPAAPPEEKRPPSTADKLTAGLTMRKQVADAIMQEVHAGLKVYCSIPEGYARRELETRIVDLDGLGEAELKELLEHPPGAILNPSPAHLKATEFFRMILEGHPLVCDGGDPLRPTVGAYLHGPPGVGRRT